MLESYHSIINILKKQTNPRQIVQLYKTYIRLILFFGCENFFYEKTELAKISTVDGNILKTMIDIAIQCHNIDLQLAFGIWTLLNNTLPIPELNS